MRSPQRIRIQDVQDRRSRGTRRPWIVRWTVDGRDRSEACETKAQAEDLRARLMVAARDGVRFDQTTGRPHTWAVSEHTVGSWAQQWIELSAPEWQPRTIVTAREMVRVVVPLLGANTPLSDLTAELCGAASDQIVARYSRNTATRHICDARTMLRVAVDRQLIEAMPWPERRTRRKPTSLVDVSALPSWDDCCRAVAAMESHQPGSRPMRILLELVLRAGLRPSEARVLRIEDCVLPETGWGEASVTKAAKDKTAHPEIGKTKTGVDRTVPLSPALVAILREYAGSRSDGWWCEGRGGLVTENNVNRRWRQARASVGIDARIYDLRHAHASMLLASGVSLGEAARRLGHSVSTLVRHYVGAMDGDTSAANALLEDRMV